jgi:hypothetical protein
LAVSVAWRPAGSADAAPSATTNVTAKQISRAGFINNLANRFMIVST